MISDLTQKPDHGPFVCLSKQDWKINHTWILPLPVPRVLVRKGRGGSSAMPRRNKVPPLFLVTKDGPTAKTQTALIDEHNASAGLWPSGIRARADWVGTGPDADYVMTPMRSTQGHPDRLWVAYGACSKLKSSKYTLSISAVGQMSTPAMLAAGRMVRYTLL